MSILIDFKYALRLLAKAPKFTAMTLSVLVGGLSVSLFTFSFLYATFYKPLPLPEGESALTLYTEFNGESSTLSAYEFTQIKEQEKSFAEFGVFVSKDVRLSFDDAGKNIPASYVDSGFFQFSRTQAILGRTIQASDLLSGAPAVAVISYDVWQNEFSAADNVLEKIVTLNDVLTNIVGVMPQGYRFPDVAKIWLPLIYKPFTVKADSHIYFSSYARLKDNVSIIDAELELSTMLNQIYQENVKLYQEDEGTKSLELMSFPLAQVNGQSTWVFSFFNLIAWLILLLACINVGNLLLARSIVRGKETAIRAALGASTQRLVSQLMWEGIIITVIGGVLSVLLVGAALDYTEILLHSWLPNGLLFWLHWGMDTETLIMALVFTLVTILFSSFIPAWRAANQDINSSLRDGTRGAQSKKSGRLSRLLVTIQVFLVALLMLIGTISGYIAHSLVNMDAGDDYTNVLRANVPLPLSKYAEQQQQADFYQSLMSRIKHHSQVEDVYANHWVGPSKLTIENVEYASENDKPEVDTISIIGNTTTVGIGLVDGRQFDHQDKLGGRKVALISQSMANRYWAGQSPLGDSIKLLINEVQEQLFIVGIVTNKINPSSIFGKLDSADEIYISGLQFIYPLQNVYYRVSNIRNTQEIFYQALFSLDRSIVLNSAVAFAENNRNMMRDTMGMASNIIFGTGLFALLLALVGIYGLTAHSVAQRTHEIGIRRAVGATDKSIISIFLKQGGKQLVIGLGLALLIFSLFCFAFNEFSDGLFPLYLYFVLAFIVVIGLSSVVLLAIFAPTRRAVEMEPSSALRYQ